MLALAVSSARASAKEADLRLKDRVVVVTGAAGTIGREVSRVLVAHGARGGADRRERRAPGDAHGRAGRDGRHGLGAGR